MGPPVKFIRHAVIIFFLCISTFTSKAEIVSGLVTDQKGEPLAYATLYVQETTKGTTTNLEGRYSIDLSPGTYELVFQYVGYKKSIQKVIVYDLPVELNVELQSEALELEEVVVTAEEDPAYKVIRRAIAKRKFHQEQVEAYRCDVYIKGMQRLNKRPDKVFGYTVPVDTGIVYLSESISELNVERPNKIREIMKSSKVSGNISNFSYNQASQMLISFYDNLITAVGLSERSFVSPIAYNAMMFYDYQMEGFFEDNGLMINKIKVIPRRDHDPVFEGHIYIIEDSWKIHSTDLILTKAHQVEFMNEMRIQQVHAPVTEDIWMMLSQTFTYDLNAFGFKGAGYFTGVHTNYQIQSEASPNMFSDGFFSSEVMLIEAEANKKTNDYWEDVRPIPLTEIEKKDYRKNDSLKTIQASRAYKDSLDKRLNKISFANIAYSGYVHQKSFKEKYYSFDPLIKMLQYNTVEGVVVNLEVNHTKYEEEVIQYRIRPTLRYGFSSRDFYAKLRGDIYWNPLKFSRAWLEGGKFVSQYLDTNPITVPINTFETLVLGNNFMKLYEKEFLRLGYQNEPKPGILLTSHLEYARRSPLSNTSSFSFFDNQDFTSNNPENIELPNTAFNVHDALSLFLRLRIEFKQRYISRPDGKYIYDNEFPRLEIYYRKGIPLLGSDINYDHIRGMVIGKIPLGLFGQTEYSVTAGTFLNKSELFFPDYGHFNGNQSIFGRFSVYRFNLLDFYKFSTTNRYYAIHYRHHFNGFVINKLPFLRKSKVQVTSSLSYLNTKVGGNYWEYGIGIEHIAKVLRVDIYGSTLNRDFYQRGIRIGLGF